MGILDNMSPGAVSAWNELNQSWGRPLSINSAYRDPAHNKKVGGAKKSQHMHGNAFDVNVRDLSREERLDLVAKARAAGFRGIGVYNNALHFDVGSSRAWGSDYTRKSLPSWAQGAVNSPVGAPRSAPVVSTSGGHAGHDHNDFQMELPPMEPEKKILGMTRGQMLGVAGMLQNLDRPGSGDQAVQMANAMMQRKHEEAKADRGNNATAQWLQAQGRGDLAQLVASGAMSGAQAVQGVMAQRERDSDPMRALQIENMRSQIDARNAGLNAPKPRSSTKDASGRLRYLDDGSYVFQDEQAPEKDMTESERRIYMFSNMQQANSPVLDRLENDGFDPSNIKDRFANGVLGGNWLRSDDGQKYTAAASAWSEAALRLATGAAATPEEHTRIMSTYFAQVGDSPETIRFKQAMRKSYEDVLKSTLAGGGEIKTPQDYLDEMTRTGGADADRTGGADADGNRRLRYNPQSGDFE